MTWDLLFLLPVPWAAPVLAPVIVAITIVGCGLAALHHPVNIRTLQWAGMVAGGGLIILSFTWDFQHLLAGNMPHPFAWWLFLAGELLSVGTFLRAFWGSKWVL